MKKKSTILQAVTIALLTFSLVGCSENRNDPPPGPGLPESKPELSAEVTLEEATRVAAMEENLKEQYQTAPPEDLTRVKDLNSLINNYMRTTYQQKIPNEGIKSRSAYQLTQLNWACYQPPIYKLSYAQGASIFRQFLTKHTAGKTEAVTKLLTPTKNRVPLFFKTQQVANNHVVPLVIAMGSTRTTSGANAAILDLFKTKHYYTYAPNTALLAACSVKIGQRAGFGCRCEETITFATRGCVEVEKGECDTPCDGECQSSLTDEIEFLDKPLITIKNNDDEVTDPPHPIEQ